MPRDVELRPARTEYARREPTHVRHLDDEMRSRSRDAPGLEQHAAGVRLVLEVFVHRDEIDGSRGNPGLEQSPLADGHAQAGSYVLRHPRVDVHREAPTAPEALEAHEPFVEAAAYVHDVGIGGDATYGALDFAHVAEPSQVDELRSEALPHRRLCVR